MSPSPWSMPYRRPRFPRVSGDEPYVDLDGLRIVTFSPRERG